jgi:hypothetical protein
VKLQNDRLKTVMLDNDENDRIDGEDPTLSHVLKMQKRPAAKTIRRVQDPFGNTHESPNTGRLDQPIFFPLMPPPPFQRQAGIL